MNKVNTIMQNESYLNSIGAPRRGDRPQYVKNVERISWRFAMTLAVISLLTSVINLFN